MWLPNYNNDFNDNLTIEDIHSWEIANYIKPQAKDVFFNYLYQPNFFRNLGIQPYAQEVTKWLSQYADLYVVTAYDYRVCKDKAEFIIENFPHIDKKNIIFCNNKGLINLDYLIDDGSHNIRDFKGIGLLYDKPWNRDYNTDLRFKSWLNIGDFFKSFIL